MRFASPLRPLGLLAALALAGPLHAATLQVTSGANSGAGSLRQALADAAAGDVITFSGVTEVKLDSQLEITKNITINGADVTLDGQLKGRVLHVASGASVSLQGLTITRGLLAGKGIDWNGTADSGSSWGAGIRNDGALVLDGVQVVGNYATGGGGGGNPYGGGGGGSGVRVPSGGGFITSYGGAGGASSSSAGGSGEIDNPAGGSSGSTAGGSGSSGGGAGGGGAAGSGGGGGWAGGGGAGGYVGAGGGGYGGGGGHWTGGGGSNGTAGGGGGTSPGANHGGAGGAASAGSDGHALSGGIGGGGGYVVLGGVWLGGGGGAAGNVGSDGGAAAGGIYNAAGATLTVQGVDCAVSANLAAGGGGAGYRGGGQAVGGLWNDGTLFATAACQTAISGNAAGAGRNGQGTGPAAADNDGRGAATTIVSLNVAVTGLGSVSASAAPAPASGAISGCTSAGGANCTAGYLPATSADVVTLTASAAPGQALGGWFGAACAGAPPTCAITMDQTRGVAASFVPVAITRFSGTTVPPSGAGGLATAQISGGGAACRFEVASTAFIAAPAAPPPGRLLPQGMFQFKLIGCEATPVTMRIDWPQPVSGLTKWGLESAGAAPSYFAPDGLNVSGNTTTFTVTDGQKGDDDWAVNGFIVDPVGPTASAAVAPIPTLGQWGLMLLGLLAAGLGMRRLRRSHV